MKSPANPRRRHSILCSRAAAAAGERQTTGWEKGKHNTMDRSRIGCCCRRCCCVVLAVIALLSSFSSLDSSSFFGFKWDSSILRPVEMASAYSLAPPVLFPHWNYLPTPVLEQVAACFTSLRDVLQTMLVCKKWYYALSDDRSEIWAVFAGRRLSKAVLKSPVLYSLPSYKAKLRALSYAWDAAECSRNIFIKPNGFTLHRNPVAQSTDAARGKLGLTAGRHCWEVCWEGPLGTVAVVGVATKDATLQAAGYVPLIGSNVHSWGWNLVENSLVHGGHCTGAYPRLANAPRYQTGDRLRIILDCDSQTLAFERDYEFLGIAFFSLPKKPLYPAVSAVYGNTEISMVYLGWPLDG